MSEIITLYRGDEKSIVERGSQAEEEMRAVGFAEPIEKAVEAPEEVAPVEIEKEEPKPIKTTKKGHK